MKMHFAAATLGLACSIVGITPALAQKTTLIVGLASADAGVLDPHINSSTPGKSFLQQVFKIRIHGIFPRLACHTVLAVPYFHLRLLVSGTVPC